MKLLSCYIENYGKIKGREYRFTDGINEFCLDNGEGKTTLASFIKAMFYGLPSYDARSKDFCDREHFYPFDGGKFGGNLTFEMDGKVYKAVRFFGEKREKEDTLRVYENGEEIALEEELGKLVFGVDKPSFERTVFLDSGEVEIASTSSIHARLNKFLEGGEDDSDLDGALKKLESAAKVYKKSKAGADKISAETARIVALNEQIANQKAKQEALEGKYRRLEALNGEIAELNRRSLAAQESNERRTQFEHYDSILEGVAIAQRRREELAARYPFGLPTEEETNAFNSYLVASSALEIEKKGAQFSAVDEEKLRQLSAQFRDDVPAEEMLQRAARDIDGLADCKKELELLSQRDGRSNVGKFVGGIPSEEQMKRTEALVERHKQRKAAYERTPAWLQAEGKRSGSKRYGALAAFALLLCAVGGVAFLFSTALGIAGICLGGALLLADGFLYLNQKSSGVATENPERARLQKEVADLEDQIKATLLPYGYYSEGGVAYDFYRMRDDLASFMKEQASEADRATRRAELEKQYSSMRERLTAFFRGYAIEGETFIKSLSALQVRIREYKDLCARKELAEKEIGKLGERGLEYQAKIAAYRQKYGVREATAAEILQDIRDDQRYRKEIADGRANAESYEREKGLGARDEGEKIDLAALQAQLQEKNDEKGVLLSDIGNEEQEIEQASGCEAEKAEAEERLKTYRQKHKLLTGAAALLEKADGRLRDKYVSPIKTEFLRYAEVLEKALGEKLRMTKDFDLRFERGGEERSEKHLSAGQKSVCALCFRLALVKNMYREQLPFLVLDDPFVGLDAIHLEKVGAVLRELSKDMQMIYFTCHESRRL